MSTVIETLAEYHTYLKYDRHVKSSTLRKVDLSLRIFTELYGVTETKELKASDMYIFYERLKQRKCKRTSIGEVKSYGDAFLQKIMAHVKSYIKRLSENAMLGKLVPADVPRGKVAAKMPSYLTKNELGRILQVLEWQALQADEGGKRYERHAAYLWRAVVWMLYTTGLRNFELRSLTYEDINIPELRGMVFGKGDRYRPFTFSLGAQTKLEEYLRLREEFFPEVRFHYLFTLYKNKIAMLLTEQKINLELKKIAAKSGVSRNVHAHLFRHTLATHLLMDGRTIAEVRDKLGHTNIATTSIYTHSNPEAIRTKSMSLGTDLFMPE